MLPDLVLATGPVHLDEDGDDLREELGAALSKHIGALVPGALPPGASVRVRAHASYADLSNAIERGEAHVAWLPPVLFVRAHDTGTIAAVLRASREAGGTYQGALFTQHGATWAKPEDLRGTRVAWVDRDSCAGYLFPRLALRRRGLDPSALFAEERFVGSHAAAVRAVQSGAADVAATFVQLTRAEEPEGPLTLMGWVPYAAASAMRALLVSPSIPSDAIVITRATPLEHVEAIAVALGETSSTQGLGGLLRTLLGAERFERTEADRYAAVREAMEVSS